MKKKFLWLTATLIGSLSQAQQKQDTIMGETATITATKNLRKQSETGKVVTVISKEQIEKSAGKSLAQLLNEQVGITVNGALNNAGTNQTVFLRGANAGRTLITLDGVPVNDPSLINTEFDLNLFSLNNVESIEICRGAQSTLYGSDAVAGVINIITVKNDVAKAFNANATITAGSFNTFKTNLQAFGKINKFTYTVRYANLNTKGFSAAYDSIGNKNYDNDAYNGNVLNARVKYQLTKELAFSAFAQKSDYKTSIDAGIFADEKDFTLKSKNAIAGAGFVYNKSNINIVGNYQYSDIVRNFLNDSLDKPGFSKYSTDDYFGKNQFLELYANINLGNGFSLLQGADYRFSNMNSQFLSISSFGPFKSFTKDSVQSQASAFASLFYKSKNAKLNIELGGRLNVHSRYGSNSTYTFNPSYTISKSWRAFGSIATGFKAPSLYQLYSSFGRLDLKPEESKNYELGIQNNNPYANSRVVYFNRDINNGIDFNNILNRYFNINQQQVSGLEVETSIKPIKNLVVSLNYTYLNPEEKSQSRETFKDTTYSYLLRRPNHNLNVNIGYQYNKALFVSISGKSVGARYDVGGYKKKDVELDSYFLLGAYAEYRFKKYLKAFLDVQNITNTKFFDLRGFNAIPTVLNVGVSFNW